MTYSKHQIYFKQGQGVKKAKKVLLTFFLVVTMVNSMTGVAQAYLLNASDLLGQVDTVGEPVYTRQTADNNVVSGAVFKELEDLELDIVGHRLFAADRKNNRVLVFNLDENNQLDHWVADYVLGQPDFTTTTTGVTQSKFNSSRYIAYDSNHQRLFVSEENNHRVTVFDLSGGITSGMDATYVLGQPDFTSNNTTTSQSGLKYPYGVEYDPDNDYLYVADSNNYRILVFDTATITDGEAAINVLGQADFTSGGSGQTQAKFEFPHGLVLDSANDVLYVTDTDNNRIMVFDVEEIEDGENAVNVLGQVNFTTDSVTTTSATSITGAYNITIDTVHHRLFVAESGNNRVTIFDISDGVTNNEAAINVLGQVNFTGNDSATTQLGFEEPRGLAYNPAADELFVADTSNSRIMIFDVAEIINGENAINLLGHTTRGGIPNYTYSTSNRVGGSDDVGLDYPDDVLLDPVGHRLFHSDQNNSRVLVYNLDTNNNLLDAYADAVLGQADFFSSAVGEGQSGLKWQHNLVLDSARQHLFAADSYNNRIMVFDVTAITNGENAINVLGQPDFTSYDATTTISGVDGARGLAFDSSNDRLFAADRNNNRILVYNVAELDNGEAAVNVLGQPDFTSNSATTTISGLDYPYELDLDQINQRLFVADKNNNRVIVYDVAEITNGEDAVKVLGQTDFTSDVDNIGGPLEQDVLLAPRGVAYDSVNNWLFVVEYTGHRVMIFDTTEITNGEVAINVLGQEDFVTGYIDENGGTNPGATQSSFWFPETAEVDETNRKLYVSDMDNNRVMIFQLPKITTASLANGTVGSAYNQTITGTGGTKPYVCSLVSGTLPTGLTLNANCTITGTPSAVGTANNLLIRLADSSITEPETVGLWHNKTFSLTIAAAPVALQITTTTLPDGVVGEAYNQTIDVVGGTEPYTCALQSGALPTGLTLNANCTITGMPTVAGATDITVRVTDGALATDDQELAINIVAQELIVANVDVTETSIEITFSGDVVSTVLTSAQELGDATNSAGDLRNYVLKTGDPLTTRHLSRAEPYSMTTEYFSGEHKMRIYGVENLHLNAGDAWDFSIAADTILSSDFFPYVTAYHGTGTVIGMGQEGWQDPHIDYIKNDPTAADPVPTSTSCYLYPCAKVGDGLKIVGSNFTDSTIVYINSVEATINAQTATQFDVEVPANVGLVGSAGVYLYDPGSGRYSNVRYIVIWDSTVGVAVGSLTLADTTTGVDDAEIRIDIPNYWGSGGYSYTHNNGKYAVAVSTAGTYEARFYTPPSITESSPTKASSLTIALGAITNVGAKVCKTPTISGKVCVPGSSPCQGVEGVSVRVHTYDWTIEQMTTSKQDGSWGVYINNTSSFVNVAVETEPSEYHKNVLGYFSSLAGLYDQGLNKNATATGIEVYLTQYNVGGTIKTPTGSVSDSNPVPNTAVPNASVQLHTQDWSYQQWTSTDESGNFKFGGVPSGSTYILEIDTPWSGDFVGYSHTSLEGLVVGPLAAGYNSQTGITDLNQDAKAVSGALRYSLPNVWGKVMAGGEAVENAWVEIHNQNTWMSINTDSTGKFKFGGIQKGTYTLEVQPPYGSSYSRGIFQNISITSTTSNDLKDQADALDGVDDDAFTLVEPNITGYVYGPTGNTGQQNVGVDLCPYNLAGQCYWAATNSDGYFGIGGVPNGVWKIELRPDTWNTIYVAPASQILIVANGAPSSLDGVAVSGDLTLRLDDPADGGLTGKVCAPGDTSDCEHPQSNVGLNLRPKNAMSGFRWGQTDQNGNFAFGGIDPGNYDIDLDPWGSADYTRKTYTITVNANDSVTVGSSTYANRSILLFLSSPNVSGYLYTPVLVAGHTATSNPTPNEPVQWAWVNLHQEGQMTGPGLNYGTNTGENGYFKFGGVQPGSNFVLETEAQWGSAYARKRYANITFSDSDADGVADECNVGEADDGDPTDKSCDLGRLLGTATGNEDPAYAVRVGIPNLRGQVVNPDGTGVRDSWVMVHDEIWMNQAGGNTDQNGYFNLGGLSNGTYQIEINMPWGGEQAYTQPSGLTVVIADDIATIKQNGVALANNKITLSTPKKILIGYVYKDTNADGDYDAGTDTVVTNARVKANLDMGGSHFETRTDANGKYVLKLAGGAWWVQVWPDWDQSQPDWLYSDPPTRVIFPSTSAVECKGTEANCAAADATATVIAAGLNFKVESANCTLTGYVKTPAGQAVANTWVDARRGMGAGNGANTDSSGRFNIKVPSGTYELMVMPNTDDYGSPDPVKVKAIANQTIDAGTIYLKARSSHIKGSVTDSAGNAVGNVVVNAWEINSPGWAMDFTDSSTGRFDITVSDGTWGVMVMPMSGDYIYQGAPLQVTVDKDESSDGNDFVLRIADTTLKISIVDENDDRVTDFWGGVWVKDASVDEMMDFGGPMEDIMEKGGMIDSTGGMAMESGMGKGIEQGGFQGGGLVNGYTEIKVPGGTSSSPNEYEIGLNSPPGATYTLNAVKTVQVVSGTDQSVDLVVKANDATIQGYLYVDADEDGAYDSGEELSGVRAFVHANNSSGGWQMTESDNNGSYTLLLSGGEWYLDAFIDVFMVFGNDRYMVINENKSVEVSSGSTRIHNFEVKELNATISGTVTDPDGEAMPNVWVFVDYATEEMVTEFKGPGGPGIGVNTDVNGDYTLSVAGGTYNIGVGIPPWDSRDLVNPEMLEVTVAAGAAAVDKDLQFTASDATITGNVTYAGENEAAFIRAWSDKGGAAGTTSTDGTYSLKVSSGDIWYISAMTKISGKLYESSEYSVTTAAGVNNRDLILTEKNIVIPDAKTSSFSAENSKSLIMDNGLQVEIPSGAIQSTGTVTVTVTPKTDSQPDSKDKPVGVTYDFVAKNADGQEVKDFVNDVKIVIPYDEDLIIDAGYAETDLKPKYFDDTTNTWESYKSVIQDTVNNTFTITTDHFTPGGLTGGRITAAGTGDGDTGGTGSGSGAGSGLPPIGPANISVWLNWGAEKTSSRTVTLSLNADNATEMLISNAGDFAGATWEPYKTTKYWTLTQGNGEKSVYIKYRDENYNVSSSVSDAITLEEEIAGVSENDLVKTADSGAVYLILNGKRHVFPHLAVYQSWAYPDDFSTVEIISSAELNQYPEGEAVPFRDGSMFRGTAQSLHGKSASAVFYVEDAKLRPIKSGEVYQTLFDDPDWSLVTWVPDDLLSKFNYELGDDLASADLHPNGCLVKYTDSSAVYLIKGGKKQPFISWDVFVANGYTQTKIFVIPSVEIYETAEVIGSLAESLTTPVIAAFAK